MKTSTRANSWGLLLSTALVLSGTEFVGAPSRGNVASTLLQPNRAEFPENATAERSIGMQAHDAFRLAAWRGHSENGLPIDGELAFSVF